MKIRNIMRTSVVSLPQNGSLRDVVDTFLKHHLNSLPIIDAAERVVGLVTIHHLVDIFLPRYHEMLRDLSALEDKGQIATLFNPSSIGLGRAQEKLILAADIMNNKLRWISQENTLLEAAAHLQNLNMESLPVVDRDQKLVGTIANFEVVLALLSGNSAKRN